MEKYTFRFKNGKFVLKESYEALAEEEAEAAATSDDTDTTDKEEKKDETPPDTVAKMLKGFGLSKEEILALYGKIKAWGATGAGQGTVIKFKDDVLNKGLDDEGKEKDASSADFNSIVGAVKGVVGDGKKAQEIVQAFKAHFEELKNKASKAKPEEPKEEEPKAEETPASPVAESRLRKQINTFRSFLIKEGAGTGAATNIVNDFLNTKFKEYAKPELATILSSFIGKHYMAELPAIAAGIKSASLGTAQADLKQKLQAKQAAKTAPAPSADTPPTSDAPTVEPKEMTPDTRTDDQKKSTDDADRQKGRSGVRLSQAIPGVDHKRPKKPLEEKEKRKLKIRIR